MINNLVSFLSSWADDPLGMLHFLLALLALIVGPAIFLTRKGTQIHRFSGYIYTSSMVLLNVSALFMYQLTGGFNLFHFFAIMSLATIVPAFWSIRKGIVTGEKKYYYRHAHFMAWSYYGLMMAGISETITRQFPQILPAAGDWSAFLLFLAVLLPVSAYFTFSLVNSTVPRVYGEHVS
ncbi:MAG: DUF2306 domain-containing protein [Pseudomonadales bacterium]|nr:DUF2306 domain-containing protein [Pseudomonadales bacterium]